MSDYTQSALFATGAYTGSFIAVISHSDIAAWTTLIATIGTLGYQFTKVIMENRKSVYAAKAEAAAQVARAEAQALKDQLIKEQASSLQLQAVLEDLKEHLNEHQCCQRAEAKEEGKPEGEAG